MVTFFFKIEIVKKKMISKLKKMRERERAVEKERQKQGKNRERHTFGVIHVWRTHTCHFNFSC